MRLIFIVALFLIVGGCKRDSAEQTRHDVENVQSPEIDAGGGTTGVGGGGTIQDSSSAEVADAIRAGHEFYRSVGGKKLISQLLPQFLRTSSNNNTELKILEFINSKHDLSTRLSKVTIHLNEGSSENCSPDPNVDAYTTITNSKTTVCFNVQRLKRIPNLDLHPHVLILWLHEIVHMYGINHSLAMMIDKAALEFLSRNRTGKQTTLELMYSNISIMIETIDREINYLDYSSARLDVFGHDVLFRLGIFGGLLTQTEAFLVLFKKLENSSALESSDVYWLTVPRNNLVQVRTMLEFVEDMVKDVKAQKEIKEKYRALLSSLICVYKETFVFLHSIEYRQETADKERRLNRRLRELSHDSGC